jgi:hypothetical protein
VDPLRPPASLLCKLGSLLVHAEEASSESGHALDWEALESVRTDPEVVVWLAAMQKLALIPLKR